MAPLLLEYATYDLLTFQLRSHYYCLEHSVAARLAPSLQAPQSEVRNHSHFDLVAKHVSEDLLSSIAQGQT